MKLKTCLILSLIANVALVAVIFLIESQPGAPGRARNALTDPSGEKATPSHKASLRKASDAPLAWPDAMAQLRRAGISSPIIAKLVVENVAKKWTPLEAQLEQKFLNGEIDEARLAESQDERMREEERELRLALGDGYHAWHRDHIVMNMNLGGLQPAEDQKEPLYLIETDWLERLRQLNSAKRAGQLDQAAFENAVASAETNYKARLAAIIGRERVYGEPVDLDPHAPLKSEFASLQLTDSQVDALNSVQQKWSETNRELTRSLEQSKTIDSTLDGDLQAINHARDEEYRRILGDAAYDAWQKNRDDRYRLLRNRAPTWDLAPRQVDGVYQLIRSYDLAVASFEHQSRINAQTGQPVDWTTVQATVEEYTRQTEATLRRTLGDTRFEQMQATGAFGLRQLAAPDSVRASRSLP